VNQNRFDGLTRSLGATTSRRDAGRALAGGALGTLFGSAFSVLAVDGKRKRDKKKGKRQTTTTVTRTARGLVTRTFTSTGPITIPAGAPGTTKGNASPYPSVIEVSGFANGVITDVDLLLQDFSHAVPEDVDILLSAPDGRRALVMSDAGRIFRVTNIDLTLDDEAAAPLTQFELDSGVFRPTDFSSLGDTPDSFTAPAPALDGSVALISFDGANPNGTWQLFVTDDASGDVGDLRAWALRITAEVDTGQVEEQIPVAKGKKHKKKGKKLKKDRK
jgi:subtilisin-like proprotein convertase family protein